MVLFSGQKHAPKCNVSFSDFKSKEEIQSLQRRLAAFNLLRKKRIAQ
jgi:uncharacterized protein YerC